MYFRQSALLSGAFAALVGLSLSAAPAAAKFDRHYNVTISSNATQNMTFARGVWSPTGPQPVLNVNDLESALANGNVKVTTGNGYGGNNAGDLLIETGFTWSGANQLWFDAYHSVVVDQPIASAGTGLLAITDNDNGTGGYLTFGKTGNITIANLSNGLMIDSGAYTLVGDIKTLAIDIYNNPQGRFALANNYDASGDGTYSSSPVSSTFYGTFEGLGNVISNMSVSTAGSAGLFVAIDGRVADVGIVNAQISGEGAAGALAAFVQGSIQNCYSSGNVLVQYAYAGGLIGRLEGGASTAIERSSSTSQVAATSVGSSMGGLVGYATSANVESSYASGAVSAGTNSFAGGLIGQNAGGSVRKSFATGTVSVGKWDGTTKLPAAAGALIGFNEGGTGATTPIANSYGTGNVTGGAHAVVGGLVGLDAAGAYNKDYSTGAPSIGRGGLAGGFLGSRRGGTADDGYWNTTTSGTTNATGKGPMFGVKGLTTTQLQSGLPEGFSPKVWAQNPGFNNGFPYLIANPPPQ